MEQSEAVTRPQTARADWVVLTLLAISLLGNLVLGGAVFRLTSLVTRATVSARPPTGPVVGTQLPPLDAQKLDGDREMINFSADPRPTLIYVFTPSCQWCAKNLDNLKALVAGTRESYRLIALSLDPNVDEYARQAAVDIPVYVRPSASMFAAYRLGPTPQTMVISREGKVLQSWMGAYTGSTQHEVESYFNIRLPGVSRTPGPSGL